MTDTTPDTTYWLAGFALVLTTVVALMVVFAVAVQGVAFPAVEAADTGDAPSANAAPGANATTSTTTSTTTSNTTTATDSTTGSAESTTTADATADAETWHRYRSIVVFRDDDIQAGWRESTLRKVHAIFVDTGVPVTDAVVPHIGDESIADDPSMCPYLAKMQREHPGQFEYALHGYTHRQRTDFHGASEFGGVPYDTQLAWIRNGTRELTACTGERPRTFVPPFNTYDDETMRALHATNYTLVSGGAWFSQEYYGKTGVFTTNGIQHVPNDASFVDNWTTDAFYAQDDVNARFDAAYEDGSLFVQLLHYPAMQNESHRAALRGLIAHMQSKPGVRFMTLGELHRGLANGTIERVDGGWRVRETPARANATGSTRPLANATSAEDAGMAG